MWSGHTPSPPVAEVVTLYVVVPLLIAVITLPDDVKETELVLYPKPWLWFCICPACQLPASLFPPSAQFRKGEVQNNNPQSSKEIL